MGRKPILIMAAVVFLGGILLYFLSEKEKKQEPKQEAIHVKSHSSSFNERVAAAVNAYLLVKDALVEDDSTLAVANGKIFIIMLDSIPMDELKNDTASIYSGAVAALADIQSNARSMVRQTTLEQIRRDFSMITEMMYPGFFKLINYEGPTLYLEHCPMAFGEGSGANWLSTHPEIVNPYMGKNHPEFKSSMLHCGELKDSITEK